MLLYAYIYSVCMYKNLLFWNAPPVGFSGLAGQFASWAPFGVLDGLTKIPLTTKLGGLVDLNFLSQCLNERKT